MKIALECKDLILENSLKLFLKDYLVLKKDCDFLITDMKLNTPKPVFTIGKDGMLKPPFSKEKLLNELNSFNDALYNCAKKLVEENQKDLHERLDSMLHGFRVQAYEKIDLLISQMKKDIAKVFEEEREKN